VPTGWGSVENVIAARRSLFELRCLKTGRYSRATRELFASWKNEKMRVSVPPAMFTLLKTDSQTAARRGRMVRNAVMFAAGTPRPWSHAMKRWASATGPGGPGTSKSVAFDADDQGASVLGTETHREAIRGMAMSQRAGLRQ
jgi:hypothetical protein